MPRGAPDGVRGNETSWPTAAWSQFGAAIDMLENAIAACPDELWSDRSQRPEFWYVAYHALFWLDFYLSDPAEEFAPPPPFTLAELDADAPAPEPPYTKGELRRYLEHGREKCRRVVEAMTQESASARRRVGSFDGTALELLLYNLRHVQHHAGQLNLILRQKTNSAPRWVGRARGVNAAL